MIFRFYLPLYSLLTFVD
jgi:hypothetical protein